MKLHNVSHKRSISQSVSAFSCIYFTLMTIVCRVVRELKSCHRVTLPSQLSGRYCMKKKKNDKTSFASFSQFHRIPSILRTLLLCFKQGISDPKDVRSNFLTLVVQSTISFILFLLHKLLQRGLALISLGKCGSPLIKVTLTELSISNLRHAFTLNQRITLSYAERSSHTKQIPSRCLRFTKCLSNLNLLVLRSSSGKTKKQD